MANNRLKYFILTGDPAVGKTTLTKKIVTLVGEKDVKTCGFYTEEVRRNRVREGFDVISLDGQRGPLARDSSLLSGPAKFRVGKYAVLSHDFDKIALSSLAQPEDNSLLVIDEIGKMEFFSESFKDRVKEIFNPKSEHIVLATIPVRKGDRLIESIRNNPRGKVWMYLAANSSEYRANLISANIYQTQPKIVRSYPKIPYRKCMVKIIQKNNNKCF